MAHAAGFPSCAKISAAVLAVAAGLEPFQTTYLLPLAQQFAKAFEQALMSFNFNDFCALGTSATV